MIDKDAGKLTADGLAQKRGQHRGIHAAGERQQHPSVSHMPAKLVHAAALEVCHGPVAVRPADAIEEIAQHLAPEGRVIDFRMELNAIQPARFIADRGGGTGCGMSGQAEALRHLRHIVPVAHPGNAPLRQIPEQRAGRIKNRFGFAVFTGGGILRRGDQPAERLRQQLTAVTDAEDRHAQLEDAGVGSGRIVEIHAVRSAGEDDADRIETADLVQGHVVRMQLAVYMLLAHTPGDQLVILTAEIKDQDFLHALLLPRKWKSAPRTGDADGWAGS